MTIPPPQPAPAPPPAPAPRVRRSGADRMVAGVCGGLADYSGIDATLWRVGFVALTLLGGGSGVLFYALLWVFLPAAPLPDGRLLGPLDRFADRLREAAVGVAHRLQGR